MLTTFLIVLPIFALVLAGWLTRRIGVLGEQATVELNRFVVYLALPALLFDIMAHARWQDIWQPGFIASFGISCLAVFALTLCLRLKGMGQRHLADAAVDGLNAAYANTGFMGFPLALVALGQGSLAATTIATIITVCVVFAIAIILIETGLGSEAGRKGVFAKVARSLLRNPLLVAPVLGALVPLAGFAEPPPVETFLRMLGGAASPCALVALGLFLARPAAGGHSPDPAGTALLVGFKLILHPLIAWLLARHLFNLAPATTDAAVLLAALPTGTGPFMLAEFYRREAATTARAILVSTVLSVVTLSAYLALSR